MADVNAIDGIQSQLNAAGFPTQAGAVEKSDTEAAADYSVTAASN